MSKQFCQECGMQLEQGDIFCKECGARVQMEESAVCQQTEEQTEHLTEGHAVVTQSGNRKRAVIIGAAAFCLVAGGVAAAVAIGNGKAEKPSELTAEVNTTESATAESYVQTEKTTERADETTESPVKTTEATKASTETTAPPVTSKKMDYMNVYSGLVQGMVQKWGNDATRYFLYDLAGDGVQELLLDEGTSIADSICIVYTIVNDKAYECGVIGGTMSGELSEDNGSLYYTKFIQGLQQIERIEKNGTNVESVHVMDVRVSDDYASYGTLLEGSSMFSYKLLQEASGWTQAQIQEYEAPQNTQTGTELKACPAGFGIVYTQQTGVNMRSFPDMYADNIIVQIPRNERVKVLSEVDGWFEVNYGGKTGFVYGEYLARGISPSRNCAAYYIGSTVDDAVYGLGAEVKIPDSSGYVSAYTPYSDYIVVPRDGSDNLVSFIAVMDGGCIIDEVYVGMTYAKMEETLNLDGITCVEDWQGDYYSIVFPIYWNGKIAEINLDFNGVNRDSVCTKAILR